MVYSISRSLPAPASRPPAAHYQTYLTPILHRRFARSCLWILAACYVEAVFLGNRSNLLWNLQPLSWTTLRCAVVFILAAMPILVLRISQLHVTSSANPSIFHAVRRSLGSFSTYSAILTYMCSCVVITALYLWSTNPKDQLGIVSQARSYERPRLNERFLYLSVFSAYVGLVQGINHTSRDRGKLELSESARNPREVIEQGIPTAVRNAVHLSLVAALTGPLAYLPIREILWENTLLLARQVYWLNRSSALPSFPVGPGLLIRSTLLAFMLCILPEICHLVFASHFAQSPFQEGKVVTDKSPDPNGTLLTGLRASKGPLVQTIAFAELAHLAENRPDRRKMIFTDVDRKPNMWEQVLTDCMAVISTMEGRVSQAMAPSPAPAASRVEAPGSFSNSNSLISPPSIPTCSADEVLLASPKNTGRKFLESVQSKEFTSSKQELKKRLPLPPQAAPSKEVITSKAKEQFIPFLSSTYGKPFRQTIQATTAAVIPNARLQANAVKALGLLACASLEEDQYGLVQKNIISILENFSATLSLLQNYASNPPIHWTDVEARTNGVPKLKEPELLIQELRNAIHSIIDAFGAYEGFIPQSLLNKLVTV